MAESTSQAPLPRGRRLVQRTERKKGRGGRWRWGGGGGSQAERWSAEERQSGESTRYINTNT